ncbi:MAG: 6-phosphogluconolactonase [Pseudomonadota bacterium]
MPASIPHMQQCRWHGHATAQALVAAAAEKILRLAEAAIASSGRFSIVLAGGNTPRKVYELLCISRADWAHWRVYFGDERCLPAQHAERNSTMAAQCWLDHVAIPRQHIFCIPAELGARMAAVRYAQTLHDVGQFDLVLLGLGEDGHTASLFPGREWGTDAAAPDVLAVMDAPKPPSERVSLSAHRLSDSSAVLFLVSGAGKCQPLADWRAGKDIPARAIMPAAGVDVLFDEAAASKLA